MFLTLLSHMHLQGLCRDALKLLVRVPLGAEREEGVCSCRVQFASLLLLSLHSDHATVPALLCSSQFPCCVPRGAHRLCDGPGLCLCPLLVSSSCSVTYFIMSSPVGTQPAHTSFYKTATVVEVLGSRLGPWETLSCRVSLDTRHSCPCCGRLSTPLSSAACPHSGVSKG